VRELDTIALKLDIAVITLIVVSLLITL